MSFTRTTHGLLNLRVFHGTDFVVFSEGGDPTRNAPSEFTQDVLFWTIVFRAMAPHRSAKVLSVGNKSSALAIFEQIKETPKSGVIICVDRDYSKGEFSHPNLINTYGYSWENDIVNLEALCEIFMNLCAAPPQHRATVESNISSWIARIERRGAQIGTLDRSLVKLNKSLQNKQKSFGNLVDVDTSGPYFCIQKVRKACQRARQSTERSRKLDGNQFHFWKDYCGKALIYLLETFFGCTARANNWKFSGSRDLIVLGFLRKLEHSLVDLENPTARHYSEAITNAVSA